MSNDKDFKVKKGVKPTVYYEKLGTVVSGTTTTYFTLESAVYDSIDSAALSSQIGQGQGIFFKPDGTKVYVSDQSNAYQYSLSTAWDLSTLAYDSKSLSLASASDPNNTFFKPDGTKFYVVSKNDSYILEYDVSTAWDISTAPGTYSRRYLVSAQMTNPTGIFFKPDGTKMYILSNGSDIIYQYSLSTAWNVTTASYDSKSFSVTTEAPNPRSLQLNDDGTKLFVVGWSNDTVYQYSLTTAYDISTAAYSGYSLNVSAQSGFPFSMSIKEDGSKLYILGAVTDKIHQYSITGAIYTATLDLSTGSVFQLTPSSNIQLNLSNPAASGTVSGATLLLDGAAASSYDIANASYDSVDLTVASSSVTGLYFKADGSSFYVAKGTGSNLYRYDMTTTWDLSTGTLGQTYDYDLASGYIAGGDARGIFFKPDGLKYYVLSGTNDQVCEITVTTPWSLSVGFSLTDTFSVSGQDTEPYGLFFKPDGTKMYVTGYTNDRVYQYTLSTAWDLSTASYDSVSFSFASQEGTPENVVFTDDGLTMFMLGATDVVFKYTLSTAWNVSTASYSGTSFSVNSQDTAAKGFYFKPDGQKLYVAGDTNNKIYQYSTAAAPTITYDTAIQWAGGTAPTSPAIGDTDVLVFTTRDGGTSYKAALAIDGAV